ncbi:TerB family tellurite resistance protein [Hydrogenophaga sp. PAMC20947]|uniref:tellurite resistance TerB family protein n=1 Tax=Hydrogenophaga sp. PAMC20947 TaxID=2565558 RepID=UPI00109E2CB7|nr:TerB family tellurite resistance protein [Hydrogenophaga sp. PAMC20947]QCB44803.1 TerB family tellurite resistance protein [Hydrogenophaga sp. PAMC20947]
MLQHLKDLFQTLLQPDGPTSAADTEHELQLATAVLLVEVMRAEPTLADVERRAILNALKTRFSLPPQEVSRLIEIALDTAKTAYDYQRFTGQLNDHFTQAQKIRVVETMWEVAYADAHLDAHEQHVISKVAGLLHVTHGEYIGAKLRAKETTLPEQSGGPPITSGNTSLPAAS